MNESKLVKAILAGSLFIGGAILFTDSATISAVNAAIAWILAGAFAGAALKRD